MKMNLIRVVVVLTVIAVGVLHIIAEIYRLK
jgi:hypothetical protein